MRAVVAATVLWSCLAVPTFARAEDECAASLNAGYAAQKVGKLVEAKKGFQACAVESCGPNRSALCLKHFKEVAARIPSVVLTATRDGQALTDVAVTLDGASLATSLDGIAIDLDPGQHTFVFTTRDGQRVELPPTLIVEGKKDQEVSAKFEPKGAPPPPQVEERPTWTSLRTVGVVTGLVGISGMVVGAIYLRRATTKNDDKNHACPSTCSGATYDYANSLAAESRHASVGGWISTIAGGALLATGAVLFFVGTPKGESAHVAVTPGGFLIVGAF